MTTDNTTSDAVETLPPIQAEDQPQPEPQVDQDQQEPQASAEPPAEAVQADATPAPPQQPPEQPQPPGFHALLGFTRNEEGGFQMTTHRGPDTNDPLTHLVDWIARNMEGLSRMARVEYEQRNVVRTQVMRAFLGDAPTPLTEPPVPRLVSPYGGPLN